MASSMGTKKVALTGSILKESKSELNAVNGSVTFNTAIGILEIFNTSSTDGTFTVNGIQLRVPANTTFKARFDGTPNAVVSVLGATTYILNRYE